MKSQDLSRMGVALVSLEEYEGVQCIQKQHASLVEKGYQSIAKKYASFNSKFPSELLEKHLVIAKAIFTLS